MAILQCSGHMRDYLDPGSLKKYTHLAVRALERHDFDTIAFRGMSGALIAPSVAQVMDKQLLLVRKPYDETHSKLRVEGNIEAKKYVIIDDFVASGNTKREIIEAISVFVPDACFLGLLEVSDINEMSLKKSMGSPYPLV